MDEYDCQRVRGISKIEPMKHKFKRKYYKSTTDSLVFRDDTDDLGRDKCYLRSKKRHNGVKPKWRAKRKLQRIEKQQRIKMVECRNLTDF
jgi:hypothetical protein